MAKLPSEIVFRILAIEKEIDSHHQAISELRRERKEMLELDPRAASLIGNIRRMDRKTAEEEENVSASSKPPVSSTAPTPKRVQLDPQVRKVTVPKKRERTGKKENQEEIERDRALKRLKQSIQTTPTTDLTKERIDATFTK